MKPYKNCMEVQEDFSALLDDELSPDEREQIEGHLSECAECLRELDALKQVDVAYSGLSKVQAPEDFEKGVRDAIRPRTLRFPLLTGPGAGRWMRPAVAIAAMALVAYGGLFAFRQSEPERFQTANLAAEESAETFADDVLAAAAPVASSDLRQLKSQADAPAAEPPRKESLGEMQEVVAADSDGAWNRLTRGRNDVPELKESAVAELFAVPKSKSMAAPEKKLDALQSLGDAVDKKESQALSSEEALEERDEVIGFPTSEFTDDAESEGRLGKALVLRQDGRELEESVEQRIDRALKVGTPLKTSHIQRGYTIGRDGSWIEKGYNGEKTLALKRDSKELEELAIVDPTINKLVRRSARVIFLVDGKWYVLEEKKE